MNRSWFDDIATLGSNFPESHALHAMKKRNIRYTPSAKSQGVSTHLCKRKRSPKIQEKINNIPNAAVAHDPERSVCVVNQEEIDQFLSLIRKLYLQLL